MMWLQTTITTDQSANSTTTLHSEYLNLSWKVHCSELNNDLHQYRKRGLTAI